MNLPAPFGTVGTPAWFAPFPLGRAAGIFSALALCLLLAAIPPPARPQQGLADLTSTGKGKDASSSTTDAGAPAVPLASPDASTTEAEALTRRYIVARIRYLEDLKAIQDTELGALRVRRSELPKPAARPPEGEITPVAGPSLWDQLAAGKNIFASVWNLRLINIGGQPVTVGKIVLGLFVLIIGVLFARRITLEFRKRVIERMRVDENAMAAFEKVFFYFFIIFVILFSMQLVSIPLSIFAFLGGAVALALGFGAQNILNNFISGWILMAERPIRIGDLIEIEGQYGSVESIGARCTRIRLFTGIHILVPNSALLEKNVVNWTLSDDRVRVFVAVGVAYGSPTRQVEELIHKAVNEHPKILPNPAPVVVFEEFGDNALLFEVHFWVSVRRLMDARKIKSDVRFRIDDLFREAGVTIAFPQRDVHLDTLSPLEIRVRRDKTRREKDMERPPKTPEPGEAEPHKEDLKPNGGEKPNQAFPPQREKREEDEDDTDNGNGNSSA